MTLTIDGKVSVIEESRRGILYVALVLDETPWKIILKGQEAETVLTQVMSGDRVCASGSFVQYKDGIFKLFADCCMKLLSPVHS